MANRPPVHVESTENGWTVVREGSERATSVYSTQSEAAAEGRELARRDGTEFFLHAQDGRVREHRNYGEGSSAARSEDKGLVDWTTETAGTLVGGLAGAASTAMSSRADAITPAGNAGGQEAEPSGRTTGADSREGTNEEEVRGLTDSRQNDASRTPGSGTRATRSTHRTARGSANPTTFSLTRTITPNTWESGLIARAAELFSYRRRSSPLRTRRDAWWSRIPTAWCKRGRVWSEVRS